MDIWTEQLEYRHLTMLENWTGRTAGRMTACDFPEKKGAVAEWYEACTAEPGREDYLVSVYETPVGLGGFRECRRAPEAAEVYLMLGEANYNLLRTATYATLQLLHRAFRNYSRVNTAVYRCHTKYLDALMRMGFSPVDAFGEMADLTVNKETFLSRIYLF